MLKGIITKPSDAFIPYPSPEDVFASNVEKHAEFLAPLASIDLSKVHSDLTGWVHFVAPIEPDGICVCLTGDMTSEYHNYLCQENTIGYRVIDNKLELATDFRYFFKEKYERDGKHSFNEEITDEDYNEHLETYQRLRKSYVESRDYYKKHASLKKCDPDNEFALEIGSSYLPDPCNSGFALPCEKEVITNKEGFDDYVDHPLTEDGRRFRFIGIIESYNYLDIEDNLLLYYDPETKMAFTTIEYS